MASQSAKLLHVEDDPIEQRVLAHRLQGLPDMHFDITTATTEAGALQCLGTDAFDLVILDYQLAEGDGLHLLREIRARDALLPVIAISGVATSEVAMDLVQSGADDYFQKSDVAPERLAQSIRVALRRSVSVRKRNPNLDVPSSAQLEQKIYDMCNHFGTTSAPGILRMLDEVEAACRRARCDASQLEQIFGAVSSKLDAEDVFEGVPARRVVRPLLLDLSARMYCEEPLVALCGHANTA